MPYPRENPAAKHDLVCPRGLPKEGSLMETKWGISSDSQLEECIKGISPNDLKLVAHIFTYLDAPTKPKALSRLLNVVAFCNASGTLYHNNNSNSLFENKRLSTIAVRRADSREYEKQLDEKKLFMSKRFAQLMKRLKNQKLVAILAPDKYDRMGLLLPSLEKDTSSSSSGFGAFGGQDDDDNDDSFTVNDFWAKLYVCQRDEINDFLIQNNNHHQDSPKFVPTTPPMEPADEQEPWKPTTPPMDDNTDDAPWKPPGDDENNNNETSDVWQPPGSNDNNDDDAGGGAFWQPPSGEDNDNDAANTPWQPPDQSFSSSAAKRPRDDGDNDVDDDDDEEFHANKGAAEADKFYSGLTRSLDTRDASRLFHMRAFNGWVKATQIQELDPKTMHIMAGKQARKRGLLRILDLACGKGGDLGKWAHHKLGISNYVGVDVARGSLKDAAIRARKMKRKLPKCTFTCADLGSDVPGRPRSAQHEKLQKLLSWSLQNERSHDADPIFKMVRGGGISTSDMFDVVSVQFAIHYMFQERKRARRFFQTVSELLDVGGNLICTTIDARVVLDKLMDLGHNLHFEENEAEQDQFDDAEDDMMDTGTKFTGATVSVGDGACQIKFDASVVKRIFRFMERTKLAKMNIDDDDDEPMRFDDEDLFGLEYSFTLVEGSDHASGVGDAVNLPEWLNPIPVLETLARDAGLELVSAENFHEFFDNRKDPSRHAAAHEALYNMKVLNRNGSICADNWEISRMYVAIKFKKVRDSTMNLNEQEAGHHQDDDDDDEEEQEEAPPAEPEVKKKKISLDAVKSNKMFPMAMTKAKKSVGSEAWSALSSDEKMQLTHAELEKML